MKDHIESELDQLSKSYSFTYDLIYYTNRSFYQVRIKDLHLKNNEIDFSTIIVEDENIDFNMEIENSVIINSVLILPGKLNQIEFITTTFRNSKITNRELDHPIITDNTNNLPVNCPIVSFNQSNIDSLSTLDDMKTKFILQCLSSIIGRLHDSGSTIPTNLIILGIINCEIIELGSIITNEELYLLSLEIDETPDDIFIVQVNSPNILKLRVVGPNAKTIQGSIKFNVETPNLYFLDLNEFGLLMQYVPETKLAEFVDQLRFFKLPPNMELDQKTKALFRLLNIPREKNKIWL